MWFVCCKWSVESALLMLNQDGTRAWFESAGGWRWHWQSGRFRAAGSATSWMRVRPPPGKYQRAAGKRVCQRYPEDAAFRTLFPVPVWPTLSGIQLEFLTGEWRKKKTQIKKHIMPHAEADGESIGCMEIPQIPHLSWKSSISRVSILPTFRFCSEENKSQSLKDHSPPQPHF